MLVITEYTVLFHNGYYYAVATKQSVCPVCGVALTVRDSRKRKVKDASGKEYIFKLRRLRCIHCSQVHLEIPDCLSPNKHYFRASISAVKDGSIDYCAADDSTIRRWKNGK